MPIGNLYILVIGIYWYYCFVTYYLKYRPKNIDELDATHAKKLLSEILKGKSIPHALLFTGPRGIGKTSSARIVAKVINCPHKKGIVPCEKCDLCKSIARGNCVDVIELDAASHRGIEDAKELINGIKLVPSQAVKKVYIIDEAHMLTTEAFNVLLKTLEEPPSHVVFILATTNREKIIPTILSRMVEVQFGLATMSELTNSLQRIVVGEKLKVADSVLQLVAETARGSFRDAAKLLEQLVVSDALKEDVAREVLLGHDFASHSTALLSALNQKNGSLAVEEIEKAISLGVELKALVTVVVDKLMIEVKAGEKEILELVDLLMTASVKAKDAILEQVPYEIAIIKWCVENSPPKTSIVAGPPLAEKSDRWNSLKERIKKAQIQSGPGLAKKILLE